MKKNGKTQSVRKKKKSSALLICKGFAKWTLAFFYSAWVFVLGILVGRETAPVKFDIEKFEKEFAALREAVMKEENKRFKIEQESLPSLDFHKLKSSGNNEPGTSIVTVKPSEPSEKEGIDAPDKTPDNSDKYDESTKPVPTKTPLTTKKETLCEKSDAPKAMPPSEVREVRLPKASRNVKPEDVSESPAKNVTIQVASFKKQEDADRMVARLKEKGYPAYVASGKVSGKGVFYRVRIGQFESRSAARSMKNKLRRDDFKSFLINMETR